MRSDRLEWGVQLYARLADIAQPSGDLSIGDGSHWAITVSDVMVDDGATAGKWGDGRAWAIDLRAQEVAKLDDDLTARLRSSVEAFNAEFTAETATQNAG